jgi:hypothetical protein
MNFNNQNSWADVDSLSWFSKYEMHYYILLFSSRGWQEQFIISFHEALFKSHQRSSHYIWFMHTVASAQFKILGRKF